mmetsp:Transcript_31877/g.58410  ORF Transcript_31877/g.58410 Transcript_31877/m.58410 type:complete len:269 (+) Transcript_31877:118-924(+)
MMLGCANHRSKVMIKALLNNRHQIIGQTKAVLPTTTTKIPLFAAFATTANPSARGFSSSSLAGVKAYRSALDKSWTTPVEEGGEVPNVMFKIRTRVGSGDENPFDWKDLTSEDIFKGKRIVLFSLPGAFTPTCSSTHLPGYEAAYEEMKKLGVDEVYCLSVNDAFVMRQWGLHQGLTEDKTVGGLGFEKVKLLPDGACQFTRGMGMSCVWDSERGFGERTWRYSAVIDDMKVEKLFVEGGEVVQNSGPDPFEVSDSGTMVDYLKSKSS